MGIIFIAAATFVFIKLMFDIHRICDANDFLKTKGEILRSEIDEIDDGLYPDIEYKYLIGNEIYIGKDVFPNRLLMAMTKNDIINLLLKFKVGYEVTVYYDKNDYNSAFLIKNEKISVIIIWVILINILWNWILSSSFSTFFIVPSGFQFDIIVYIKLKTKNKFTG